MTKLGQAARTYLSDPLYHPSHLHLTLPFKNIGKKEKSNHEQLRIWFALIHNDKMIHIIGAPFYKKILNFIFLKKGCPRKWPWSHFQPRYFDLLLGLRKGKAVIGTWGPRKVGVRLVIPDGDPLIPQGNGTPAGIQTPELEVLGKVGSGAGKHTLKEPGSYLVLSMQVQCNPGWQSKLAGVSSAVQGRRGPFYRSPGRQGVHRAHICAALFTLLPATPLRREPAPAGKAVGVKWAEGYTQGIRPRPPSPSSSPAASLGGQLSLTKALFDGTLWCSNISGEVIHNKNNHSCQALC